MPEDIEFFPYYFVEMDKIKSYFVFRYALGYIEFTELGDLIEDKLHFKVHYYSKEDDFLSFLPDWLQLLMKLE